MATEVEGHKNTEMEQKMQAFEKALQELVDATNNWQVHGKYKMSGDPEGAAAIRKCNTSRERVLRLYRDAIDG